MPKRRGHGEGGIYQRESDGKWCASVDLGFVNGKRRRKVIYGQTRREVADKLKVLHRDQAAGVNLSVERTTIETLLKRWLEEVVAHRNKIRTYESCERIVTTYLVPHIEPIPGVLLESLRRHKLRQDAERQNLDWQEHGLVFVSIRGTPLEPDNVTHRFKEVLRKAGLPETVRFHDLRHSCATLLLAQGVPPRVVMEILGHDQVSTTTNIFGHVLDTNKRDATAKIEELFGEEGEDNDVQDDQRQDE